MMGVVDEMRRAGQMSAELLNAGAGFLINPFDIPGVAVLISAGRRVAGDPGVDAVLKDAKAAVQSQGLELRLLDAADGPGIERAFQRLRAEPVDALVVASILFPHVGQILDLAARHRVPAAYVHEDAAFHDIIMRMSGDRLSKAIIDGVQSEALRTHGYSGRLNVEHVKATHEAHKRIQAAIAAHDPEGAARAMREHIESSWAKRRAARPRAD